MLNVAGHVFADITFTGPEGTSVSVSRALVDTGATYAAITPEMQSRLEARPIGRVAVSVAGGKTEAVAIVPVMATLQERTAAVFAVVLPGQDPVLIGSETLEILGFRVDPMVDPPRLEPSRGFTVGLF